MATQSLLPISDLVSVTVNLTQTAAQSQSLSNLLVLGSSAVIDTNERIRQYTSLSAVVSDFGTSAPEYFAASAWFDQSPQPQTLSIGRWAQTATSAVLQGGIVTIANQQISVWNAITNGGFHITANGGSLTNITGLNFSGATNLNGVASIITTALATASVSATIVWNAAYQSFTMTSGVIGTSSTLSFLSAPTAGTDISDMLEMSSADSLAGAYTVNGIAAESAVSSVAIFDQSFGQTWYGLFICGAADSDHEAVAAFIEGTNTKHMYFVNTQEGGVLSASSTSDIAYILSQLAYKHTVVQYSSTSLYAVCSLAGRVITVDYNGNNTVITAMYKQEPGIAGETITQPQLNALIAKNANIFVTYDNSTTIIQPGITSSGYFIDIITGTDWLSIDIQNAVYNLLYTSPTKIPQTDRGMAVIKSTIISVLSQSADDGLVAPGIWTNAGFGLIQQGQFLDLGYAVYAPPVSTQSKANRNARLSVPFQVGVCLAGAVQTVNVSILVVE